MVALRSLRNMSPNGPGHRVVDAGQRRRGHGARGGRQRGRVVVQRLADRRAQVVLQDAFDRARDAVRDRGLDLRRDAGDGLARDSAVKLADALTVLVARASRPAPRARRSRSRPARAAARRRPACWPSAGPMSRAKSPDSAARRASDPGPPPDSVSSITARVSPRVARSTSSERRISSIARRFCGSSSVLRLESTAVRVVGATTPAQPHAASANAAASGHAAQPDRPSSLRHAAILSRPGHRNIAAGRPHASTHARRTDVGGASPARDPPPYTRNASPRTAMQPHERGAPWTAVDGIGRCSSSWPPPSTSAWAARSSSPRRGATRWPTSCRPTRPRCASGATSATRCC